MSRPERDPSVFGEPHLRESSFTPDPSESKAAEKLAGERAYADPVEERAKHSVFDEPTILPNRPPVLIDRDWNCRNCGYNLRGLMTGHPCPECGVVEKYEPPREGELSYSTWLERSASRASPLKSWAVAAAAPILGIPLAVVAALVTVEYGGLVMFVLIGPAVSEASKAAFASLIVEHRGPLVRRPAQIYVMTLGTAVVFAAVQNLLTLSIYYANPAIELVVWRWSGGIVLHCLCALLTGRVLVREWQRGASRYTSPEPRRSLPSVTAAILVHAAFNLLVYIRGFLGYGF